MQVKFCSNILNIIIIINVVFVLGILKKHVKHMDIKYFLIENIIMAKIGNLKNNGYWSHTNIFSIVIQEYLVKLK